MKTMRLHIMAMVFIALGYGAPALADMTCAEACKLDGLTAKAGMENASDTTPPCMCLKPRPVADNQGQKEKPQQQPQQPPPPPQKNGGDDECSQQGAGSGGGASCESGAERTGAMASGSVGGMSGPLQQAVITPTSVQGAQSNVGANGANGAAMNQIAQGMNQAIQDCKSACDSEKQCRQQKKAQAEAQQNQGEAQQQEQKMQKADQNKQKCEAQQGKADQAMAQAMAFMQAMAGALASAKSQDKTDGVAFDEVAPTKTCGNKDYFSSNIGCLCDANFYPNGNSRASPRDPRCQNLVSGDLKLQVPPGGVKTTAHKVENKPLTDPFKSKNDSTSGANGDTAKGSGGASIASSGKGGAEGSGPGAPLSPGRSGKISIGEAPAGGGGGGFSPYTSKATAALRDFASRVMGKKDFKNRSVSGMSVKNVDGITGPTGPSIWEKTTKAYQTEENRGHWNKEAGMPTTRPPYELIKNSLPPLPGKGN